MGPFLEKEKQLVINQTNKNDILKILGPPSTKVSLIMMYGFILKEKHPLQNLEN